MELKIEAGEKSSVAGSQTKNYHVEARANLAISTELARPALSTRGVTVARAQNTFARQNRKQLYSPILLRNLDPRILSSERIRYKSVPIRSFSVEQGCSTLLGHYIALTFLSSAGLVTTLLYDRGRVASQLSRLTNWQPYMHNPCFGQFQPGSRPQQPTKAREAL